MSKRFSVGARLISFKNALRGIALVVRTQHNAWIHALATAAVLVLGAWLCISPAGWCWLVVAVVMVWAAEAFNTALERLADATAPDPHPLVRDAKDAAAGAVLTAALGAAAIGILILGPPLWLRISSL